MSRLLIKPTDLSLSARGLLLANGRHEPRDVAAIRAEGDSGSELLGLRGWRASPVKGYRPSDRQSASPDDVSGLGIHRTRYRSGVSTRPFTLTRLAFPLGGRGLLRNAPERLARPADFRRQEESNMAVGAISGSSWPSPSHFPSPRGGGPSRCWWPSTGRKPSTEPKAIGTRRPCTWPVS